MLNSIQKVLNRVFDSDNDRLRVDVGAGVTLEAGDIELGAVELKNATDDTRAKVTTSPAVDTDAGLVVRLPRRGSLTDRSGTITTGNTSQQLAAANASRRYLFVGNPPTATESLWINFGTAAVKDQPSIEIAIGASFVMEDMFVSDQAVNIIAATTGHKFVSKEG